MSFIKICRSCKGEGHIRDQFFSIIKKKCSNCNGTGKVHVGWDKDHDELKNLNELNKNN